MASIQDLYKRNNLGYIEKLIMKVTNYAWQEMTLLEQGELRQKAYDEFVELKSAQQKMHPTELSLGKKSDSLVIGG